MSDYIAQPCSPAEVEAILAYLGAPVEAQQKMLKGFVDAVCREANGEVAWEVHQPNLVTDLMRRRFMNYPFIGSAGGLYVCTSPSAETPVIGRTALNDDGNASSSQSTVSTVTPTYDSNTLTKTWAATFAAPAANRTIGTIGLSISARNALSGLLVMAAYTVLSPTKVQTTSQTLEIQYRVTLTPAY